MKFIAIVALLISQISANTIMGPAICPPDEGACAIKCNTTNQCSGRMNELRCASGDACAVYCTAADACYGTPIHVYGGATVAVQCTAMDSCTNARISDYRVGTGNLEVQCTAPRACEDIMIRIGKDAARYLEIQCTAANACSGVEIMAEFIHSSKVQEITVWCMAQDACKDMRIVKGDVSYNCIDEQHGNGECVNVDVEYWVGDENDDDDDVSTTAAAVEIPNPNASACYDTEEHNPCTEENRRLNNYYFKSCTSCCHYIQCEESGVAHDKKCLQSYSGTHTYWNTHFNPGVCDHNNGECTDAICLIID